MQMFVTSPDCYQCSVDLDDVRLRKIIVESAQILSTSLWINNCDKAEILTANKLCYLPTHENHPIVKWTSICYGNFKWCLNYCRELCLEYKTRFNKKHKTFNIWLSINNYINNINFKSEKIERDKHINCTTNHKHIDNVYEAYQLELKNKWFNDKRKPIWTNRNKPNFYDRWYGDIN